MGTGRPSSSGATGGLNASASAFVFAPRRCPAAVDVVVERAMPVPVDELASLGLVSEEDGRARRRGRGVGERERGGGWRWERGGGEGVRAIRGGGGGGEGGGGDDDERRRI